MYLSRKRRKNICLDKPPNIKINMKYYSNLIYNYKNKDIYEKNNRKKANK